MKAAQINQYGDSSVVETAANAKVPEPEKGQVQVEVYCASINPFDWKLREGYMKAMIPLQFPATLGMDFSGVIIKVGAGSEGFKVGDEVYGQAKMFAGAGAFAELAVADVSSIALKPNVDFAQAAALPLTAVSAYQALVTHINLKSGQRILIHGGAGGIGTIAIQIAKHLGAYVATTAAGEESEYVKALGADEVIDYKNQKFEDVVQDYNAVFDTVGSDTYTRSFSALKSGGIIVSMVEQPNKELMKKFDVKAIAQMTKMNSKDLVAVAKMVNEGSIIIHIDKKFPLEQTATAMDYLQQSHPKGKVVIQVKHES